MTRGDHFRLVKFSLVGAIGIVVQFGLLKFLIAARVNYLVATALAVEGTVVHNFLWHQHLTWSDRTGSVLKRLFRFLVGNGAISLLGNLLAMRLLVGTLGLPVLIANLIAVSACFVANFLASDRWIFLDGDHCRFDFSGGEGA